MYVIPHAQFYLPFYLFTFMKSQVLQNPIEFIGSCLSPRLLQGFLPTPIRHSKENTNAATQNTRKPDGRTTKSFPECLSTNLHFSTKTAGKQVLDEGFSKKLIWCQSFLKIGNLKVHLQK